jgi:hypothetical protein
MSSTDPHRPGRDDLGPEDPGDLSGVEASQDDPIDTGLPDDDVVNISDNEGPELTTDVDDIDPGSSGGR